MQFGFALPHVGTEANKEAIVAVAQRAEALGFDSLWVLTGYSGRQSRQPSILGHRMDDFQKKCKWSMTR